MGVTKEEEKAIAALKRVAQRWPKSLWLFAADGELHIMCYDKDHKHAILPGGGMDPAYEVDCVKGSFDVDGGDW